MKKSATDVMQEILFAAVIDGVVALKEASKGMPNTLLRDVNAIHPNATFADLPKELQAAINNGVRTAFTRLLKEGYAVAPNDTRPAPRPASSPPQRPGGPGGRPMRPNRPGGGPGRPRPAGGPGKPPRKPNPSR